MRPELLKEPVSSEEPAFVAVIEEHLDRGEVAVVLLRYANCGGVREYFLVRNASDLQDVLRRTRPRTAITVFFESAFQLSGSADRRLAEETSQLLDRVLEEHEGVDTIKVETSGLGLDFDFLATKEQVSEWFEQNEGARILVGLLDFTRDNNDRVITTYVPDLDGVIRFGDY